jgi:hypothetical protein
LALTRLPVHLPARATTLAGVMRFYPFDSSGRLVFQPAYQQSPARPQDSPVEATFGTNPLTRFLKSPSRRARHVFDLEVFDSDKLESACEVCRNLLNPVLTPVSLASAQPGDGVLPSCAAGRSPHCSREAALQPTHAPLLTCGQTRNGEEFSCRQSRRYGHTSVNSYDSAISGRGNWIGDQGEREMPTAGAIHRYAVGLRLLRYWAGPAEPHPSGLWHPDLPCSAAQSPNLLWRDRDDPEPLIPPRLTPRRAPGRILRVKERDHCLGEVPQRLLLNDARACSQPWILRPCLGELPTLLYVAWRTLPARAPVRVLLDRQVPYVPGVGTVFPQHHFLGWSRNKPVTRHANIISIDTDIFGEVKRCFRPGLSSGAFAPQSV